MSWQPRVLNMPNCTSDLMIDDHRRYVAILQNYLTPVLNFRFKMNKYELDVKNLKNYNLFFLGLG